MSDPTPPVPDEPTRIPVERYLALAEEGAFAGPDRVELLEGVIVAVPPSSPPHAAAVALVADALRPILPGGVCLRVQSPLALGRWSAPEPDVAVVPGVHRDYAGAHPRGALLVVEVAAWSLQQDRLTKGPLYARAGVPEYWILDLAGARLEVMRDPDPRAARHRSRRLVLPGEVVVPLVAPSSTIRVAELLPGDLD